MVWASLCGIGVVLRFCAHCSCGGAQIAHRNAITGEQGGNVLWVWQAFDVGACVHWVWPGGAPGSL